MTYLSTLLLSMFITVSLIPMLKVLAVKFNAVDMPNERKVHDHPIPRVGGIAMGLGILVPVVFWLQADSFVGSVFISAVIIFIFGVLDDIKDLGYRLKLLGQFTAGIIVIIYGHVSIRSFGTLFPVDFVLPFFPSAILTLVVIIGVTNAINLADGLDGLAGGVTILSFLCIAYLAYATGNYAVAMISVGVIGAIFGFLRFNTFPATVFMGDTGSQLLGFLAITFSIYISQNNAPISPLFPLLLFGIPVLDTLLVMTIRMLKGMSPFKADKTHLHHRLMTLGLYHSEAVFVIYTLQTLMVSAAFLLRFYSEWVLLLFYLMSTCCILLSVFFADRSGWRFHRGRYFDNDVKGRFREFRDKNLHIRFSFGVVKITIPLLLIFTCFVPCEIPAYFTWILFISLLPVLVVGYFNPKVSENILRIVLYLALPFLMYFSEISSHDWLIPSVETIYSLSFGLAAAFMLLTLKFTRRKRGFKVTPLDFLILIAALAVPGLLGSQAAALNLKQLTVKVIVMLFGYEVLFAELRGQTRRLSIFTLATLFFLTIRGFVLNL